MRISGSPAISTQTPGQLRPDVAERLQRNPTRAETREQSDEQAIRSIELPDNRQDAVARPVAGISETSAVNTSNRKQQLDNEQLSLNARKALQTFSENTPSPEQQLGIELARIDIVV